MKAEKQTAIFELIRSMDRTEKGYFNKYAKMLGKGEAYIGLFNILSQMKHYDKNELIKKAAKKNIGIGNTNTTLHHLYRLILKSLRLYHEKNHYKQQINCLLAEAEVLSAKNLKKQAVKHLKKAEQLAKENHYYTALIEIQKTKIIQEFAINKRSLMETVKDSYHTLESSAQILLEELEFRKLKHLSLACIRINQMDSTYNYSNILREISNNGLLNSKSKPTSFYSLYYKESTKSSEALLYSNLKAAHIYYKKIVKIWDDEPQMIKVEPMLYHINLTNYIMNSIIIKAADDFEEQFQKLEHTPVRSQNEKIELLQNRIYLMQLYGLNYKKLDQAYENIEKDKELINRYELKMNFSRLTVIQYNYVIICLLKEKFDDGLYWINKILHNKKVEPKKDIRLFCSIIELIFHYEMNHFEVVESLLNSIWRKRKKESSFSEYTKSILQYLKYLEKSTSLKEKQHYSKEFLIELEQFKKQSPQPIGIEELILWTTSKIKNVSIESIYLKH